MRPFDPDRVFRGIDATSTLRGPVSRSVPGSNCWIQMARWPSYRGALGGRPLLSTYALPSSSKKIAGSMPSISRSHTGSDHGPAADVAVETKVPPLSTAVFST
jgi:hypothetical protein